MESPETFQLLADITLVVHALFVGYVVLGFGLILVGMWAKWRWINNFWFRMTHLLAISFVVLQTWLGQLCPLTILENYLRQRAGQTGYERSFIEYWLQKLLFYDIESWIFTVLYTAFGALVLGCWLIGPRIQSRTKASDNVVDGEDETQAD